MAEFKPKILLVDDEAEGREALARLLRAKGYEIVEVATGTEALARAKQEWPGLIILDVVLPDIPGTEVFEKLRADPITKAIPVLMLTAKPGIAGKLPITYSQGDRMLEKPGRVDDLMSIIHDMLTGKR